MKNKILLYLFIFTLISALFIYVNDKKILDARNNEISEYKDKTEQLESDIEKMRSDNENLKYFSLTSNEDALSYFEKRGIEGKDVVNKIQDELISRNKASEDNELVPFEGMNGPMRINKIKVLNHKWVIADFTDGTYWGEIFLTYAIDDEGNISFNTEKSFLYPKD